MKLTTILYSIVIGLLISCNQSYAIRSPSPTRPGMHGAQPQHRSPSPQGVRPAQAIRPAVHQRQRSPSPRPQHHAYVQHALIRPQVNIVHHPAPVMHRPVRIVHRPVHVVYPRPFIPAPVHIVHHPAYVPPVVHTVHQTFPKAAPVAQHQPATPPSKNKKLTLASLIAAAAALTTYGIIYLDTPKDDRENPEPLKKCRSRRAFEKMMSGLKNPGVFLSLTAAAIGTGYWICND